VKYFYKHKLNYIAGLVMAMESYKIADLEKGIKDQEWKNHHTCHVAYLAVPETILLQDLSFNYPSHISEQRPYKV